MLQHVTKLRKETDEVIELYPSKWGSRRIYRARIWRGS